MGPIEELWKEFDKFSTNQTTGLSKRVGWNFNVPDNSYKFIKSPKDGSKIQINSGDSLNFRFKTRIKITNIYIKFQNLYKCIKTTFFIKFLCNKHIPFTIPLYISNSKHDKLISSLSI